MMNPLNHIQDLELILEWGQDLVQGQGLEEVGGEVGGGEGVEVAGEVEEWGEEEGGVGEDDQPGLGVIMKRELRVKDQQQRVMVCRTHTLVRRGTYECSTYINLICTSMGLPFF